MGDVKPKVVLITGASSGIGQACARHLARRGYQVFGTSRRPRPGPEEPFEMIRMDVTDEDSVSQGVATVLERAGRLDVVVNNAGFGFGGAVEDTSLDEAREMFETNFFGMLRVCRAVLPHFRERRAGTIVNVSSLNGLIGMPFVGMYCATKFAMEGVTEALRMEVRPFGIRVVMIEPGDTRTGFTANRRPTQASRAAESPYAENMQRVLAVIEHDENTGSSPEAAARLLERILRSRSPRLRYPVASAFQRFAAAARKFMPAGLFERLLIRYYRVH
jgi:NAD(P)-dependent dehydrogenase (short-subunit alcohol dehydrogenase family)